MKNKFSPETRLKMAEAQRQRWASMTPEERAAYVAKAEAGRREGRTRAKRAAKIKARAREFESLKKAQRAIVMPPPQHMPPERMAPEVVFQTVTVHRMTRWQRVSFGIFAGSSLGLAAWALIHDRVFG